MTNSIILVIATLFAVIMTLSHKEVVPYLAQKFLPDYNVSYAKIEGTLLNGLRIYDLQYKDDVSAKKITIDYNLLGLLRPSPSIRSIDAQSLHLKLDNFQKSDSNASSFSLFGISVENLILDDLQVTHKDTTLHTSLKASDISYGNSLHVNKLSLRNLEAKTKQQTLTFASLVANKLKYKKALHVKDLQVNHLQANDTKYFVQVDTLTSGSIEYEKALHVKDFILQNAILRLDKQKLEGNLSSKEIHFDENKVDLKKLKTTARSSYGDITLDGNIISNRLQGDAHLILERTLLQEYLHFLKEPQKEFDVSLDVTPKIVQISTKLPLLRLQADENMSIQDAFVSLKYILEDGYATGDASYKFAYQDFRGESTQSFLFTPTGAFESQLSSTLNKTPFKLPFKKIDAKLGGDRNNFFADIKTDTLSISVLADAYKSFMIHAQGDDVALSFLDSIPEALKDDHLTFSSDALLELNPFVVNGNLKAKDFHASLHGNYEIDTKGVLLNGSLNPKEESPLFKDIPLSKFAPYKFTAYASRELNMFNLEARLLNISLFKNGDALKGWGNFNTTSFDANGSLAGSTKTLTLSAKIPSLKSVFDELNINIGDETLFRDAEANIQATLGLSESIAISTRIDIPWYAYALDEQTIYAGVDSFVEAKLLDKALTIERYNIEFLDHRILSQKKSQLFLDDKKRINLDTFWIYDTLALKGFIDYQTLQSNLTLKSDSFSYNGQEGNITAATNLSFKREKNGKNTLEGEIKLLDGLVTYMPKNDYTITDEDIIIIQNIKEPKDLNRFVNIHVISKKPIHYKIKNIDLQLSPDITLYQEPNNPISLLGTLHINSGEVKGAGKTFTFKPSDLYFYGENILNPYLDLNLHYTTLNYINIEILVTNNVSSPIIIFSSNPSLSQNDIMSYLLFGEPATSVFDSSGEGRGSKMMTGSLLLGSGLKSLINQSPYLKIDTLNILTNKEGTLGYEIGSRITKDLRVVYKNDTISGLIVQYSLGKSTRFDVDVHETGQGVSLIYMKDF